MGFRYKATHKHDPTLRKRVGPAEGMCQSNFILLITHLKKLQVRRQAATIQQHGMGVPTQVTSKTPQGTGKALVVTA